MEVLDMQGTAPDDFWGLQRARRIFSSPRIDRDLVTDFFMVFARAEYALKRAGYVSPDASGAPRIRWDNFARTVDQKLFDAGLPHVYDDAKVLRAPSGNFRQNSMRHNFAVHRTGDLPRKRRHF
jgi:hypothetical protein